MSHPLFNRHDYSFKHQVHFSCAEDWTEGVVDKLKQLKTVELKFDSKIHPHPAFKQATGIDRLKQFRHLDISRNRLVALGMAANH